MDNGIFGKGLWKIKRVDFFQNILELIASCFSHYNEKNKNFIYFAKLIYHKWIQSLNDHRRLRSLFANENRTRRCKNGIEWIEPGISSGIKENFWNILSEYEILLKLFNCAWALI